MSSPNSMLSTVPDIHGISAPRERLNLNELMQQALHAFQTGGKHLNLIIRCESLPHIEGNKAQVSKLFANLLQTIVPFPPRGNKLFLYIDCEEQNKDIDAVLTNGHKRFLIQFYTNIITNESWKRINKPVLVSCEQIVAQLNASLTVNDIKNTGCLFSISLLGKL
jgi:hypothetical protein